MVDNYKVTIITPCYNGESYMEPYINGLLSQTYTNVEYIFVNDGSTDKTEEIILSYKQQFIDKGWSFIYLKKENKGQASAINQGLKIMTGDFLSNIDADDILLPNYIEEMSSYLSKHEQYSLVFPTSEFVKEKTFEHIKYAKRELLKDEVDQLFDDIINQNIGIPFPSYMLRVSDFLKNYPDKQIYEGGRSQNLFFVLPFAYQKKVGYLDKLLFKYVVREISECHFKTKERAKIKFSNYEDVYSNILKYIPNMPDYEKAYYFNKIKNHWALARKNFNDKLEPPIINEPLHLSFIEKIFSVKNEYKNNTKCKVITILGIKIKCKIIQTNNSIPRGGGVKPSSIKGFVIMLNLNFITRGVKIHPSFL